MSIPNQNLIYKIFYDDQIMYIGRTKQPLQSRLRGHFFSRPMLKILDAALTTKIEYAACQTTADMYLYEIYYINKLKPPINYDDRANDELTVNLPELKWIEYECPLLNKWRNELLEIENKQKLKKQKEQEQFKQRREMRLKHKNKIISDDEYENLLDEMERKRL